MPHNLARMFKKFPNWTLKVSRAIVIDHIRGPAANCLLFHSSNKERPSQAALKTTPGPRHSGCQQAGAEDRALCSQDLVLIT